MTKTLPTTLIATAFLLLIGTAASAQTETVHEFTFDLKISSQGTKETKNGDEAIKVKSNLVDGDAATVCGGVSFIVRMQCDDFSSNPILLVTEAGAALPVGTLNFDANFFADETDKNGRLRRRVVSTSIDLACVFNVVTLDLLGDGQIDFRDIAGQDCPDKVKVDVHGNTRVFQDGVSTRSVAERGRVDVPSGVLVIPPPAP